MSWDNRPSNFSLTVRDDIKRHRNLIALDTHRRVVLGSPVDTGRYRGSHVLSVGVVADSPESVRSQGQAISEGYSAILSADTFQVVHISSNLPYTKPLENGHSKQAPNGIYGPAFNGIRVRYAL